jgi:hypothetical protein
MFARAVPRLNEIATAGASHTLKWLAYPLTDPRQFDIFLLAAPIGGIRCNSIG